MASILIWGSVEAIINSCLLVFISEMGDKTQLLALLLVARFRKPWIILAGVFAATVLNHALAAAFGDILSTYIPPHILTWGLALSFFIFAAWILIPDKETEVTEGGHLGAFLTAAILFFIAEMGDKTQLATIALAAAYSSTLLVTIGSTIGMLASNALAIFWGAKLLDRIPMKWIRIFACSTFVVFGIAILVRGF